MNIASRQKAIKKASSIIVKVGTRLLTDTSRISLLISQIEKLREKKYNVLLVSSGAVGLGMKTLGMTSRPKKLSEIQALAAVGQSKLMSLYEAECRKFGFHAAQLLLTAADIQNRERHLNVLNCIYSLWNENILPIVNENDSVSVDELKFGDNDRLAALIATMTRSGLTVLLTMVDGLHSLKDGKLDKRISVVSNLSDEIRKMATGTDDSSFSVGGMSSKLSAAETVTKSGEYLWIADGKDPEILVKIINAKDVGTLFLPASEKQMDSKKRWLSFFSKPSGIIIVDDGAAKALSKKGGSLLPSGITGTDGNFNRGDTVAICDRAGATIAKGLSNYSDREIGKILGRKSSEASAILGYDGDEEIVHRNNMVLC
ncbi:MAG: glutamate 5-kinase [Victivallales bacterium]|jgi:glutamate 5-kinase